MAYFKRAEFWHRTGSDPIFGYRIDAPEGNTLNFYTNTTVPRIVGESNPPHDYTVRVRAFNGFGVKVANDDFGNFERRRLDSCGVSAPHSSGHGIACFELVGSSYVQTPEGMAERGYAPIGRKPPEVGDIVAMEGLPDDWVINVLTAKVDATVVTIAAGRVR